MPESMCEISDYSFVRRFRENGKRGGVVACISNKLVWGRRMDMENEEVQCIWIEIKQNQTKGWLIATLYRPPDELVTRIGIRVRIPVKIRVRISNSKVMHLFPKDVYDHFLPTSGVNPDT